MKPMSPEIEKLYAVVSVIEDETEAKNVLDVFINTYTVAERKEILTELENRDSRFQGWDSHYKFIYSVSNISGDALNLGRKVRKLIESGNYHIELVLKEVL